MRTGGGGGGSDMDHVYIIYIYIHEYMTPMFLPLRVWIKNIWPEPCPTVSVLVPLLP